MAEKPFKSRFQRRKKQTLELKWDQMRARQRWDKKNKIKFLFYRNKILPE